MHNFYFLILLALHEYDERMDFHFVFVISLITYFSSIFFALFDHRDFLSLADNLRVAYHHVIHHFQGDQIFTAILLFKRDFLSNSRNQYLLCFLTMLPNGQIFIDLNTVIVYLHIQESLEDFLSHVNLKFLTQLSIFIHLLNTFCHQNQILY